MNANMPARLLDLLTHAPWRAVYESLRKLGCESAPKSRSVEWAVINDDGVPVFTLWDVCMSRGSNDQASCDIPTATWRKESEGQQVGKADRLSAILEASVGKQVRGLICEPRNADGTASIGLSSPDYCDWLVVNQGSGNYRLIREDRDSREATAA